MKPPANEMARPLELTSIEKNFRGKLFRGPRANREMGKTRKQRVTKTKRQADQTPKDPEELMEAVVARVL